MFFSSFCVSSSVVEDIPHDGWKFFRYNLHLCSYSWRGWRGWALSTCTYWLTGSTVWQFYAVRSVIRCYLGFLHRVAQFRGCGHEKLAASQEVTSTQHVGAKWKRAFRVLWFAKKLCREMLSRFLMQFVVFLAVPDQLFLRVFRGFPSKAFLSSFISITNAEPSRGRRKGLASTF